MMSKRYVIRKYVMAKSVKEALKLEKTKEPDEVWVDKDQPDEAQAIGFEI